MTLIFSVASSFAQKANYFSKEGVAINGYDAVAYFSDDKAIEGSKDFSYDWQEIKWSAKQ